MGEWLELGCCFVDAYPDDVLGLGVWRVIMFFEDSSFPKRNRPLSRASQASSGFRQGLSLGTCSLSTLFGASNVRDEFADGKEAAARI